MKTLLKRKKLSHLPAALVLFFPIALTACGQSEGPIGLGSRAPDFKLPALDGKVVTLSEFRGDGLTLINFWATWCGPCKKEVPILEEIQKRYRGQGIRVLAVAVEEKQEVVAAFAKKRNITYPVVLDSGREVAERFGLLAVPLNVIVDQEGTIVYHAHGGLDESIIDRIGNLEKEAHKVARGPVR